MRNWELETQESFDPTDGFAVDTIVQVSHNRIVLIEPNSFNHDNKEWISDKGRQFFDGIFGPLPHKHVDILAPYKISLPNYLNDNELLQILTLVLQTLYIFEHCKTQQKYKNFFLFLFENLSLETLNLLNILTQTYTNIKAKKSENYQLNTDFETNLQLNKTISEKTKLSKTFLCLLVSTNPRYEGSVLNLKLRQKHFKGDFQCFCIGSTINLTFPTIFLGSNLNILKNIFKGINSFCQTLQWTIYPLLIFNYEFFKRNESKHLLQMLKILNYSTILKNSWNGINILSSSLYETGSQSISTHKPLLKKDLIYFNSILILNLTGLKISNLKKIIELKLLKYSNKIINKIQLILDYNYKHSTNNELVTKLNQLNKNFWKKYFIIPATTFYENQETFLNTEGFVKQSTKLVYNKAHTNWQIIKKIFTHLQKKLKSLNTKNNHLLFFDSTQTASFKNFSMFQYQNTKTLTITNFYLNEKTENFTFIPVNFKWNRFKFKLTKLKYWLDDFFIGGKDEYSQQSVVLTNCSKIIRFKTSNF